MTHHHIRCLQCGWRLDNPTRAEIDRHKHHVTRQSTHERTQCRTHWCGLEPEAGR